MKDRTIFTIGHSNHSIEQFVALLQQHGITALADVRSAPYSRFQVGADSGDIGDKGLTGAEGLKGHVISPYLNSLYNFLRE